MGPLNPNRLSYTAYYEYTNQTIKRGHKINLNT